MRYAGWAVLGWLAAFIFGLLLVVLADGLGVAWAVDLLPPVGAAIFILGGATVVLVLADHRKRREK